MVMWMAAGSSGHGTLIVVLEVRWQAVSAGVDASRCLLSLYRLRSLCHYNYLTDMCMRLSGVCGNEHLQAVVGVARFLFGLRGSACGLSHHSAGIAG